MRTAFLSAVASAASGTLVTVSCALVPSSTQACSAGWSQRITLIMTLPPRPAAGWERWGGTGTARRAHVLGPGHLRRSDSHGPYRPGYLPGHAVGRPT